MAVSTHSRPKAAAEVAACDFGKWGVSTHSRPKAAARRPAPPHSPPPVSTHSRPKAAAPNIQKGKHNRRFQHTAARRRLRHKKPCFVVKSGFNTQPPEGGCSSLVTVLSAIASFQHTAARRRLHAVHLTVPPHGQFQHTAARRRLQLQIVDLKDLIVVSTHSRPKAAASGTPDEAANNVFQHTAARRRLPVAGLYFQFRFCFNTQPPEGGCIQNSGTLFRTYGFNTQPPEGGCSLSQKPCSIRFRSPNFAKLPRKARTRV